MHVFALNTRIFSVAKVVGLRFALELPFWGLFGFGQALALRTVIYWSNEIEYRCAAL
jgi:hypothetical protein